MSEEELQELLLKAYERGFKDGKDRLKSTHVNRRLVNLLIDDLRAGRSIDLSIREFIKRAK